MRARRRSLINSSSSRPLQKRQTRERVRAGDARGSDHLEEERKAERVKTSTDTLDTLLI